MTLSEWVQIFIAGGTLAAAVAAGFSARASLKTAKEAYESRKNEMAPRLVLERDFFDFQISWQNRNAAHASPVLLSRKNGKDRMASTPTFSLSNFGGGPAIEVEIVFDFEDDNGGLEVPDQFRESGISNDDMAAIDGQPDHTWLNYSSIGGNGSSYPLYRKFTVDIPNCAPGQTRTIEFPQSLMHRLFLRGLHYWERGHFVGCVEPLILTVTIHYYTLDGDGHKTQFRFKAEPFFQGEYNPLIVYVHFDELAMYEKSASPRVS